MDRPHDWSPDGKWIAVSLGRRDRTVHIGRSQQSTPPSRTLVCRLAGPTRVVFSPDGRFIAYDLPVGDRPARDVFVMDTRTRLATPTIVHRANDVVAGWAPNGTSLLFTSDRSGSIGVWEVPMANGAPAGTPTLLKSDLGSRSFSISVTSAGTLFYGLQTASLNVYTAEWTSRRAGSWRRLPKRRRRIPSETRARTGLLMVDWRSCRIAAERVGDHGVVRRELRADSRVAARDGRIPTRSFGPGRIDQRFKAPI